MLGFTVGRLEVRMHAAVPLVVLGLWVARADLSVRYLLLLATLLLHELAHAAAALALGGRAASIRIWPVFGRADVDTLGGRREAWVALAAPAANLACAGILFLCGARFSLAFGDCPLPDLALTAQLLMGLGNLVPILPADGGRALAALRGNAASRVDSLQDGLS